MRCPVTFRFIEISVRSRSHPVQGWTCTCSLPVNPSAINHPQITQYLKAQNSGSSGYLVNSLTIWIFSFGKSPISLGHEGWRREADLGSSQHWSRESKQACRLQSWRITASPLYLHSHSSMSTSDIEKRERFDSYLVLD